MGKCLASCWNSSSSLSLLSWANCWRYSVTSCWVCSLMKHSIYNIGTPNNTYPFSGDRDNASFSNKKLVPSNKEYPDILWYWVQMSTLGILWWSKGDWDLWKPAVHRSRQGVIQGLGSCTNSLQPFRVLNTPSTKWLQYLRFYLHHWHIMSE